MTLPRILVIGGYGAFGARAAERLARGRDVEVVIAGRDAHKAEAAARDLGVRSGASTGWAAIDAATLDAATLRGLAPSVVVNASGPFQAQDYAVPRAAIAAGSNYVDLADARGFVTGIGALDAAARQAGVLVASGASSVPALSSAVVNALSPRFDRVRRIEIVISPGNSFDPGLATVASVLGGVGRPIVGWRGGGPATLYGWQGLERRSFGPLGARWTGYVDVPDLALFPAAMPDLDTCDFRAGLEVSLFHLSLWALSWPVRAGLVTRLERFAPALLAMKRRLSWLGSDAGGMLVTVEGTKDGEPLAIRWRLLARRGHGPNIPAIAAVVLARRLATGKLARRGAMPAFGLITVDDFASEVADLDIEMSVEELPQAR